MFGISRVGEIDVNHTGIALGRLGGVAEASEDAFDDVDVMLSTIEVTHVE
jgi:hypothetical protein